MIVYHTADLHLKADRPKRLEVLKWLCAEAGRDKAAAFVICGDLFDSDADASVLRTQVKKILERCLATTFYLLPGNHDAGSYHPDYDYGRNAVQLIEKPFQVREQSGVRIGGVPYQPGDFSECVRDLPAGLDILAVHGTLYDRDFIRSVVDDEETKYMPIMPADIEDKARYVALGHIHARPFDKLYRRTRAANPGSALALDVKCRARRVFYRLEIDRERLGLTAVDILPSPHWQDENFFVFPGREERTLSAVQDRLSGLDPKQVLPNLNVRGFLGEKGREFHARLKQIVEAQAPRFSEFAFDDQDIKSWDQVVSHPTVQRFLRRTEELDDELRCKVYDLVLPIFSETIK